MGRAGCRVARLFDEQGLEPGAVAIMVFEIDREKYCTGTADPFYEKLILQVPGIDTLWAFTQDRTET